MRPAALALLLLAPWAGASAPARRSLHPLHTSLAEIAYVPAPGGAAGWAVVTLRVFTDDFGAATDSAAAAYLAGRFGLADAAGRPLRLGWIDRRRIGDLDWIRLRVPLRGGLRGLRVRDAVLCERFGDQVNIVRATYGGRTASLLFVAGDGPKTLP